VFENSDFIYEHELKLGFLSTSNILILEVESDSKFYVFCIGIPVTF
jgi:hypothetical protein